MRDALSPFMDAHSSPSPPPPHSDWKSKFSPFYYGIIIIASTAILLTVYHLAIMGLCWRRRQITILRTVRHPPGSSTGDSGAGIESLNWELIPSATYRKDEAREQTSNYECAVCLSAFIDGEEFRELPQCKHSFHAACIDMWLYSHSNCPLCRAAVVLPSRNMKEGENFGQGLPDSGSLV